MSSRHQQRHQQRRHARAVRGNFSASQQARRGRIVCEQLIREFPLRRGARLALYSAIDGEIDTRPLRRRLCMRGINTYLPVVHGPELVFTLAGPFARLSTTDSELGIPEPSGGRSIAPPRLDLVIMPLTAFDLYGNRLGMGGGFYDHCFAFKRNKPALKPLLVGLAHEEQRVTRIEAELWDVPLHAVVTDKRVYRFTR